MLKSGLKLLNAADIALIIIIILTAAGSYVIIHKSGKNQNAYIYYRSNLIGVFPLNKNMKIKIKEGCIAEIKNGKIRMLQADCPDKICVRQGWSDMMPIICLPNQIVIEIKSDNRQEIHILH
ncbi:MAG TPA: NusG domain II-containing protein [Candidatus Cloacimonadota bacterium]|nr:NusG domain II-containing protein [Candidatus Cloacimonadota bacterium]